MSSLAPQADASSSKGHFRRRSSRGSQLVPANDLLSINAVYSGWISKKGKLVWHDRYYLLEDDNRLLQFEDNPFLHKGDSPPMYKVIDLSQVTGINRYQSEKSHTPL
eukprot:GABV01009240.1.p2 GENE.GABV01009240.1~~GABV01009240.1.p2  ORF type:complete len:107 (-),score=26.11 GABV01009240.1:363-683(-)